MKKEKIDEKGITQIALIITIVIVLLILIVVAIALMLEKNRKLKIEEALDKEQKMEEHVSDINDAETAKMTVELKDINDGIAYYLIKFKDDKGIYKLIYENGTEIYANNKTSIAIDYQNDTFHNFNIKLVNSEGKTTVKEIEKNDWTTLLKKANIDYTLYTDFPTSITTENAQKIADSDEAMEYIGNLFWNATWFTSIANNSTLMSAVCENSTARLAMYNKYAITENIIQNSPVAIETMKSSSRYYTKSGGGDNLGTRTTLYNSPAFMFEYSGYCNREYGGMLFYAGYFVTGEAYPVVAVGTSGQTLTTTINKFSNSIVVSRNIGWQTNPITVSFFAI